MNVKYPMYITGSDGIKRRRIDSEKLTKFQILNSQREYHHNNLGYYYILYLTIKGKNYISSIHYIDFWEKARGKMIPKKEEMNIYYPG